MTDGDLHPYLFGCLEVLDDHLPRGGAYNMALDEVLLQGSLELPLLRLYRWAPPAVSFGYFEHWRPVAAKFPAHEWLRRWTGGGVVEHESDWTYSLLLPRTDLIASLPARESYRLIHASLRRALHAVGLADITLLAETNDHATSDSRACFASPVHHDLIWQGRKISGAAQRRTRRALLHQGSVQAAGLQKEATAKLNRTFPLVLAPKLQSRFLSQVEDAAANDLADRKYATVKWLQRV